MATNVDLKLKNGLVLSGDIQQDNAQYHKAKTAAGTSTRLFGVNAADTLYIGSVDAALSGGTLFVNNGATQMSILSSGNVGIGTSSPGASVDVVSAKAVLKLTSSTTTNGAYTAYNNAGGNFYVGLNNSAGTDFTTGAYAGAVWHGGAYPLVFGTGNAERMRIDASGNVGVGTVVPGAKLDVSGNIRLSAGSATIELNAGGPQVYCPAGNTLAFATGGGIGTPTERLRIGSTGLVGIGRTASNYGLEVVGGIAAISSNSTNVTGVVLSSDGTNGRVTFRAADNSERSSIRNIDAAGPASMAFFTNDASANSIERMRIDSVGNVGVGTSSPFTKLEIAASNTTGDDNRGNLYVRTTDSFGAGVGGKITLGGFYNGAAHYPFAGVSGRKENATDGSVAGYIQLLTTTSAGALSERMRIDSVGNVGVGYTSLPATSGVGGSVQAGLFVAKSHLVPHLTSAGVLQFVAASNRTMLRSYGATAGTGMMSFHVGGGGGSTDLEAMVIDSAGNVSVNKNMILGRNDTSAEGGELVFNEANNNTRAFTIDTFGANVPAGAQNAKLRFMCGSTNAIQAMEVNSNGDVGIGTSAITNVDLAVATHINLSGTNQGGILTGLFGATNNAGDTFTTSDSRVLHHYGLTWKAFSDTSEAVAALSSYSGVRFYTAGAERMRVDQGGSVKIGATSSIAGAGERLGVSAPSGVGGFVTFLRHENTNGYGLGIQSNSNIILYALGGTQIGGISNDGTNMIMAATNGLILNGGNTSTAVIEATTLRSASDNARTLGTASFRWSTVYAGTGSINTSDANLKEQVQELTTAELAVSSRIKNLFKSFKFKDSVLEKGSDARIHVGVLAQEVQSAFEAEGLQAEKYALFCSDEVTDEAGNTSTRLGIRYEELLAFVAAADVVREAQTIATLQSALARIEALEARLA